MRVFEKAEGEFKLLSRAALGEGVGLKLFDDDQLLTFQIGNAPLIGRDDRGRGGFHDPVEQLLNLLFGLAQVIAQGLGDFLGSAATLIPCFEEQLFEQTSGLRGRAQGFQQRAKLLLNHIALDGFAATRAALGEAVIIGMLLPGLAL